MGNLVFQATLGGQVNLVGPNTASTFNLNVPAVSSTIATTSGTETLTNKTLTTPVINGFTGDTSVVNIGSGQFYKDTSGNIGIGVTPSAWALSGSQAVQVKNASLAGYLNNAYLSANVYFDSAGASKYIASAAATQYAQNAGSHYWYVGASGTAGNAISFTTAMTLDASGNLGIGTTSPSAKLHVNNGFLQVDISGTQAVRVGSSDSILGGTDNNAVIQANTSKATIFLAGGSERARIDSSGNLLVGNTQTDKGVLTVYNNAASFSSVQAFAYFKGTQASDSGTSGLAIAKYANDNGNNQIFVRFLINNGNNGNGQIVGAGSGAAAFSSYSDARLKENIVDLPSQLDNIMALRPVEFDYIESEGGGHQIGFIAQEMQEVYPDAVGMREPDQMLTVTGWSKTEARLVKAIQEQQAVIESLTARITALEA